MFVMRTKTNLKKPYMFPSVRRPSSGVSSRALYNYYLSIFPASSHSSYVAVCYLYVCACAVLVGVVTPPHQQVRRKHTHTENM